MSPKRTENIPLGDLLGAVKRVLVDKTGSLRQTAKDFGIPRSSLQRYIGNVKAQLRDVTTATDDDIKAVLESCIAYGPTGVGFDIFLFFFRPINSAPFQIFSQTQERALMDYILKCRSLCHGLSITEVKQLAFQYAQKIKVQYPDIWNEHGMAGRKWFDLFIKRHPNMTLCTPQQISKESTKKTTTAQKSKKYISSSSPSEADFCIICMKELPPKLTKNNSIECNECHRPVHLACANIQNSYFTCIHCDSEFSEEE